MNVPSKLPILRMEDYHTHFLGKIEDGRFFWGYETFVFTKPFSEIQQDESWKDYRKEFALVHTFDENGNYLETKHWSSLATEINSKELHNKLEEMVSELGNIKFQDIEVKIFQTKIDNIVFGLIVDEENEMIHLEPSSTISFEEPWDGEYYT